MKAPTTRLISMPWAATNRPSLGIGTLLACVRRAGFDAQALYLNLRSSVEIGVDLYEFLADTPSFFGVAEHLFAAQVFSPDALESDEFLRVIGEQISSSGDSVRGLSGDPLRRLRDRTIPKLLDACCEEVLDTGADVFGFSCTFNQVFASLALAKRIRERAPKVRILLGGACVHGAMGEGYARAFPDLIDHVFTGEADFVLPAFLRALEAEKPLEGLPGVTVRGCALVPAVPASKLDELPIPQYEEYFSERRRLEGMGSCLAPFLTLPYESARGCWWGQKNHCTFCGLNNEGMAYRTKSDSRVVSELASLASRYRTTSLTAADNILSSKAYARLLPKIADLGMDLDLFYEIKANLRRDDVATLATAGVRAVQPGVESFSNSVLRLMKKGVSALQNVQLLKWLKEWGVRPSYNILLGFAGEADHDYEAMLRLMEAIRHLDPPSGAGLAQVHRFAPFFFDPEGCGIRNVRAASYYKHLLPEGLIEAEEVAYFFDRDLPEEGTWSRYLPRVNEAIDAWQKRPDPITGNLGPGFMEVLYPVPGNGKIRRALSSVQSLAMVLADHQVSLQALLEQILLHAPGARETLGTELEELLRWRLLLVDEGRVVSVVPLARPHREAELAAWLDRWPVEAAGY